VRGSHLLTRPFYRPTPPWPDFIFSPPVPAPQHLTLFANTQKNSYGVVLSIDSDVARVSSFSGSSMGSVVSFCSPEGHGLNILGIVLNLQESHLEVAIASYGDSSVLGVGCLAQLHSDELNLDYFAPSSGCVFDALGTNLIDVATFDNFDFVVDTLSTHYPLLDFNDYHSYNSFTSLAGGISFPLELPAPTIVEREPVARPLHTGVKVVDTMFPIGRGQRELIIGDRKTGKTALALDSVISQYRIWEETNIPPRPVTSVYVAIGQKLSTIKEVVHMLKEHDAVSSTIFVVSSSSDSSTLQYLSPYTGCTFGSVFRDNCFDSLVIYDDLSKHAVAYRQLSLVLRRPPGREAYPGDVFYLHSRLLERSAQLLDQFGGGSMTALPIIETQGGDISAYIPTNVISITDGQIFLEGDLFYQGVRPAVNVGLSVSRVGSKAQPSPIRRLASHFKSDMAQYRESLAFSRFGSDLDFETIQLLERGSRYVELFKQKDQDPYTPEELFIVLLAASSGALSRVNVQSVILADRSILASMRHGNVLSPLIPFLLPHHGLFESNSEFPGSNSEVLIPAAAMLIDALIGPDSPFFSFKLS